MNKQQPEDRSGSVGRVLDLGSRVASWRITIVVFQVLEKDLQPRTTGNIPDITEKLVTGM